jgi:hypothetical protein
MSELILKYTFDEGRVENPDGTLEGQLVNGAFEPVTADVPGWGHVSSAVRFNDATILIAPVPPRLAEAGAFTIELVVELDRLPAERTSLLAAAVPPISMVLDPTPLGVRVIAEVLCAEGWLGCASEPLRAAGWTALSMSFAGGELVLLVNGHIAARRAAASAKLATGDPRGPLFVGTPVEGGASRLRGAVGGVRAWDGPPDAPSAPGARAHA